MKSLTGIRGVAALFVVLYHFLDNGHAVGDGLLHNVISHGYLAVDVFFILSGFVMALNYEREMRFGTVDLRTYLTFLLKRLGRIYPLYLFVFISTVAMSWFGLYSLAWASPGNIIANILLIQAWGISSSIPGQAWSISAEFLAYVLFPLLLLIGNPASARRLPIALLVVGVLYTLVICAPDPNSANSGPLDVSWPNGFASIFRCLAGFLLGLATFGLTKIDLFQKLCRLKIVGVVMLGVTVALLMVPSADIGIVVLLPILLGCLYFRTEGISRLFNNPIMTWLGTISYSIYLNHILVSLPLRPILHGIIGPDDKLHLTGVVLMTATVVASYITYICIERPARDIVRKGTSKISLS